MKKVSLLLALSCVATVAMANGTVVVKDTRQYMTYTASLTKTDTCSIAADPDHPSQGNCEEVRAKAPISGMYVLRSGDWCQSDSYSPDKSSSKIEGRPIPSVQTEHRAYRCDAQGNPV